MIADDDALFLLLPLPGQVKTAVLRRVFFLKVHLKQCWEIDVAGVFQACFSCASMTSTVVSDCCCGGGGGGSGGQRGSINCQIFDLFSPPVVRNTNR